MKKIRGIVALLSAAVFFTCIPLGSCRPLSVYAGQEGPGNSETNAAAGSLCPLSSTEISDRDEAVTLAYANSQAPAVSLVSGSATPSYTAMDSWYDPDGSATEGEDILMEQSPAQELPTGDVDGLFCEELDISDEEFEKILKELKQASSKKIRKGAVLNSAPTVGELTRTSGSGDYGYNLLNAASKAVYEAINTALAGFVNGSDFENKTYDSDTPIYVNFTYSGSAAQTDVRNAFASFIYDHPQYFFIQNGYGFRATGNEFILSIPVAECYYSGDSRKEASDAILSGVEEWIDEIRGMDFWDNNELSDDRKTYEAALTVHDMICEAIDYAYDGSGQPESEKWAHSIAGVFTGEGVVCEGYAKTFNYIMNILGIDNLYVVGDAKTGSSWGGHAWNAVGMSDGWFLIDSTWDDLGAPETDSNPGIFYAYFGMNATEFVKTHRVYPQTGSTMEWYFALPDMAADGKYFFYKYAALAYSEEALTGEAAEALVSAALPNQRGNHIQIVLTQRSSVSPVASALANICGVENYVTYTTPAGYLMIALNLRQESIAEAIVFEPDVTSGAAITVGGSASFTAVLQPAEAEDTIVWTVENISEISEAATNATLVSVVRNGSRVTVTGIENGKVKITAKGIYSNVSASFEVTVGTGVWEPKYVIFSGGDKNHKTVKITPKSIAATSWKDTRGKTKQGKLVYLTLNSAGGVQFDSATHKVSSRADKDIASISNKGVVTAKAPGTVYVYICDTGSMTYEMTPVVVEASPSKLTLSSKAGSTEREDVLKNTVLAVGYSGKAYIIPFEKNEKSTAKCTYTAALVKAGDAQYLSVGTVTTDNSGNLTLTVTARSADAAKGKPVSVKVVVTCVESGKKANMTVAVTNPVTTVRASAGEGTLAKKRATVTIALDLTTAAGAGIKTTDKLKVYVSKGDITLDDKKVITERGATVKAALNKAGNAVVITANKDAGEAAKIGLVTTDPKTKKNTIYIIAAVDQAGNVTVP